MIESSEIKSSLLIFKFFRFYGVLVLTFMCLLSEVAGAQNATQKKIDSLELTLPSSTGLKRFEVLRNLLLECIDFNNQKGLLYAQQADSLVRLIGDSASIKRFDWLYSQILRKTGNNSKAIETAKEALMISKRDGLDEDEKKIYNILAVAHIANAEYDEALSVLFEGLIIFEKDKNYQEISIVLNSIGAVFFRIENYQKALNYFQESLSTRRAIKFTSEIDRLLINMAQCQAALNKFEEAIKLANEGLAACNNHCSPAIKAESNFALGIAFFGLHKIPEALAHFEIAYSFSRNSGYGHVRAESLIYLAKISALNSNRKQAIAHLVEAEEAATNNSESLLRVYKEFISVYKGKEKEIDRLIHYQRLFIDLKERIYTSGLTDNLARVEADYKERWNTAMISHQQKVITLNEELIQKQNIATIAIVAIIILFLAFIVILYRNNQFKKQIGIRLEKRVRERSDELNESIRNLEKTYTVQESKTAQMNAAILQYTAELETLCNETCQNKELDSSQQEYMIKMNETLSALREYVARNMGSKKV